MDVNQLRSVVTVLAFVAFIGILLWAYKPSRKEQFDDAAQLPFKSE
jgi:cytochrome c oxidase cbb3-type subunit IV